MEAPRRIDDQRVVDDQVMPFGAARVLPHVPSTVVSPATIDRDGGSRAWPGQARLMIDARWFIARAVWPYLEEEASIVNVSSNAGLVGFPELAAYCAAKGGLVQLTRAMALDATSRRVRVNCICPGHIRTPMGNAFVAAHADPVEF